MTAHLLSPEVRGVRQEAGGRGCQGARLSCESPLFCLEQTLRSKQWPFLLRLVWFDHAGAFADFVVLWCKALPGNALALSPRPVMHSPPPPM